MIKQNPFSLYDFFGYFVPGALMIYLYLISDYIKTTCSGFKISEFFVTTSDLKLENQHLAFYINWILKLDILYGFYEVLSSIQTGRINVNCYK